MHFTDLAIRGLRAPEKGQNDYWDDGTPGFGVAFKSQRLAGKPETPGEYRFTVEYIAVKAKKAGRVRYKYTILK